MDYLLIMLVIVMEHLEKMLPEIRVSERSIHQIILCNLAVLQKVILHIAEGGLPMRSVLCSMLTDCCDYSRKDIL